MRILTKVCGMLLACAGSGALAQADAAALAKKFGALETVAQASLSPDGGKVAFTSEATIGTVVYVADLDAGGKLTRVMSLARSSGRITSCSWSAATRLVCRAYYVIPTPQGLISATRMHAVDADGKNLVEVTAPLSSNARGSYQDGGRIIDYDVEGKQGSVLMTRQVLPDDTIGTRLGSARHGLGVDLVDTLTRKRVSVEKANDDAFAYITDGHGTVRVMGTASDNSSGYLKGDEEFFFRKPGERNWQRLSVRRENGSGFVPVLVDGAKNVAYGFDDDGDYRSLYTTALDGSGAKTKVLGKPGFDVDSLITIGRNRRVVGASYATERRETEYFDPDLRKLSEQLRRALPGQPSVDIVDASQDESKLLVIASSDTLPGQFYLYDKTKRALEEVLPVRPELEGAKLATMQPISFKAADGTMIPGYLTLPPGSTGKNLPAIVMPHGGPSARDEWGFDWLSQYYASRGFAVLQPNYRGSAGYGSAFFQKNGFQGWRTAIGDVNDAGRWLVAQGIAAPGKLAIVGWSYGGYAALQSAVLDPALYKAIVAIAPVVDLAKLRADAMNYTNGPIVARFVGSGPHVAEGSPAQNVEKIKAPVLMFSGDRDLNVDVSHPRLMHDRLTDAGKASIYVEFPGLDHQIADAAARTRILSESDAFLRKNLGLAE